MSIEDALKLRIKELCEEKGLTINALSALAGMPRSTLKNIIYGKSKNTGIVTIQLICDALEISVVDFFSCDLFKQIDPIKD